MIKQILRLATFAMVVSSSVSFAKAEPLKLASYVCPGYDRTQASTPLAKIAERATGQSIEIVLFNNPEELAEALKKGVVDLAVTNLASYIDASKNPLVEAVSVLNVPAQTQNNYRGVLLARKEIGVLSIAELNSLVGTKRYAEAIVLRPALLFNLSLFDRKDWTLPNSDR